MPRRIEYEIKVIRKEQDAYVALLVGPPEAFRLIPQHKRLAVASSGWKAMKRLAETFRKMGFME